MPTRFCENCGTTVRDNDLFCGSCGFSQAAKEPPPQDSDEYEFRLPQYQQPQEAEAPHPEPEASPQMQYTPPQELDARPPEAEIPAAVQYTPPINPQPAKPVAPQHGSLLAEVNAVSAHNQADDVKTMAFYDFADAEPVVGWLVCVRGEYLGQSFNLKAGQNFIGRALNMDVALAKDTSVSRHKHAILTFDPHNRLFFIQPGESSGLTYHCGNLLLAHQHLNAYECIKVGNSELIFVPFSGEMFTWDDYI